MSWDSERVRQLKSFWLSGLSASQIARKLGGGVSRNAVIGKVHRLGLGGRGKPKPVIRTPAPPPAPPAEIAPPAPVPLSRVEQAGHTQNAVLALTERRCRWPLGDPRDADFRFCGSQVEDGRPYCAEHNRMAYQQTQTARRASA